MLLEGTDSGWYLTLVKGDGDWLTLRVQSGYLEVTNFLLELGFLLDSSSVND